jgi:hypothetical protein
MTVSSGSAYFSDEVRLPLEKRPNLFEEGCTTHHLAFGGEKLSAEDLSTFSFAISEIKVLQH